MVNVSIAASCAQKDPAVSPASPCVASVDVGSAMANRNDPEETRRSIAAERIRLQAVAKKNELRRPRQQHGQRTRRKRAAKAAGVAYPKLEEMIIKSPTRPPPKAKGGVSSAASSRTPTPPQRPRVASPRPPSTKGPALSGSAWDSPPPVKSPPEILCVW